MINAERHIRVKHFSSEDTHMKVSGEQAAENRERIIEVAGRLFRERGLDGIGVANLKGAGLTHGGRRGRRSSTSGRSRSLSEDWL
jgi:hypothetical protein